MTLVRRLAAMLMLWVAAVAVTAPTAAAGGLLDLEPDASPGPPSVCPPPALLTLPCVTNLPLAPVTDLLLEPAGTELVPALVTEVDELLPSTDPLPVSELLVLTELTSAPLPVAELLQPVTAILAPPTTEADVTAGGGPDPQPLAGATSTSSGDAADATADLEPAARLERTIMSPTSGVSGLAATQLPLQALRTSQPADAPKSGARLNDDMPTPALPIGAAAAALLLGGGASMAVELARGGGGAFAGVIAFNVWLRRQLRESRMSQRQLAAFSGVDHSTISRLLSGEHAPSLVTATKLVEALRKLGGLPHAADYFARLAESRVLPTKRVEEALLGDDELDDQDVRQLMHAYLVARARRRGEREAAAGNGSPVPSAGRTPA